MSDLIKNIRNRYPNIPAEDIPRTLTNLVHDGYLSRPATGLYRLPVH
ncbi:hypothetical protein [Deinococcus hopiensis]|nr:hypothetical protein [Deinococcus hopiensis]